MNRNTSLMMVAMVCLMVGCIAYRAPVVSYMSGPENAYNQERSGVQSRATTSAQQTTDAAQAQTQTGNTATADMASNAETTRQIGLKQGQAQTSTTAQGKDQTSGTAASTGQAPVGQNGSDQLGYNPGAATPTEPSVAPTAANVALSALAPDVQTMFQKYWTSSGQTAAVPASITPAQWSAFQQSLLVPAVTAAAK